MAADFIITIIIILDCTINSLDFYLLSFTVPSPPHMIHNHNCIQAQRETFFHREKDKSGSPYDDNDFDDNASQNRSPKVTLLHMILLYLIWIILIHFDLI